MDFILTLLSAYFFVWALGYAGGQTVRAIVDFITMASS